METVFRLIDQTGMFSEELIKREIDWYYNKLGLDLFYFHENSAEEIADHVLAFITAKLHARSTGDDEGLRYEQESNERSEILSFLKILGLQFIFAQKKKECKLNSKLKKGFCVKDMVGQVGWTILPKQMLLIVFTGPLLISSFLVGRLPQKIDKD